MSANDNARYNGLIDYGGFMLVDVQTFLPFAGWGQIIIGICLIMGLFTRIQAAIAIMMGLVTIIVPGLIIMQDVPHFAYAFAFTGGALVMFQEGSSPFSLDHWLRNKKSNRMSSTIRLKQPLWAKPK
jgi:uncharacterized membrane protein YphA (DoxX/SURF4 family)